MLTVINLYRCDYLHKIKRLYWGDTWIYADIPMANKVDRKTISEHTQAEINPELMVGDEILVVEKDPEDTLSTLQNYMYLMW